MNMNPRNEIPSTNEMSFGRLKQLNKLAKRDLWDSDKNGRDYLWTGDVGSASDLSCKGQIIFENDDPIDELESCSLLR